MSAPPGAFSAAFTGLSHGLGAQDVNSATNFSTAPLWDLETGQCVRVMEGHSELVNAVDMTADGRIAVSGSMQKPMPYGTDSEDSARLERQLTILKSDDPSLRVWDLESGVCLRILSHRSTIGDVSVTPDGRRAISAGDDGTLRVFDLETGACVHVLECHTSPVNSVIVTADGRRAISAAGKDLYKMDSELWVWDADTGICLHRLEGHTKRIECVTVTPDGRRAVSASQDKTLRLWDLETGLCLCVLRGHTSWITSVSVTPDGRRAASVGSGYDKTLRVWDLETGSCLRVLKGYSTGIDEISVTPDGRRAVSAGSVQRRQEDVSLRRVEVPARRIGAQRPCGSLELFPGCERECVSQEE
jgi:WD40 repeat protein